MQSPWPYYPDQPYWQPFAVAGHDEHAFAVDASLDDLPRSSPDPDLVKQEEHESCFIMESPSTPTAASQPPPPTEVPLRASQASPEMLEMMTVFRVNPFAIQGAAKVGAPQPLCLEACPLDEEPLVFEFQLEIPDDAGNSKHDPDLAQLRPFSPGFELHPDDSSDVTTPEDEQQRFLSDVSVSSANDWDDASHSDVSHNSVSPTRRAESVAMEEPRSVSYDSLYEETQPRTSWPVQDDMALHRLENVYATGSQSMEYAMAMTVRQQQQQRLHTATSHPYLRKPSFQSPGSTPSPQMVAQPIPYAQPVPSPIRNQGRHMMHIQSPPSYHPSTPPQTVPATAPTMSLAGLRPEQTSPVSHNSRLWTTRMNSYTQAAPVYVFDDGMVADAPKYSTQTMNYAPPAVSFHVPRRWSLPEGSSAGGAFLGHQ